MLGFYITYQKFTHDYNEFGWFDKGLYLAEKPSKPSCIFDSTVNGHPASWASNILANAGDVYSTII